PEISVHLMAVTPTAHWLEWLDLASPILEEPLEVTNGQVVAPERPGAGMTWNEDAVQRFLVM
ncbi:MAG TPA: enolase C-terminal domain-like protein, partial [Thermomicrobiales bacterium]|nr:enolase C-terminal domain-like protein [Thermomicrobiales bacterium]